MHFRHVEEQLSSETFKSSLTALLILEIDFEKLDMILSFHYIAKTIFGRHSILDTAPKSIPLTHVVKPLVLGSSAAKNKLGLYKGPALVPYFS